MMEEQNEEKIQENGQEQKEEKTPWQLQKESWYDRVPLTVKQLDIIIGVATALLILVCIIIGLDAYGVF